jgi:hypothetical protein
VALSNVIAMRAPAGIRDCAFRPRQAAPRRWLCQAAARQCPDRWAEGGSLWRQRRDGIIFRRAAEHVVDRQRWEARDVLRLDMIIWVPRNYHTTTGAASPGQQAHTPANTWCSTIGPDLSA